MACRPWWGDERLARTVGNWLQERWNRICLEATNTPRYWTLSVDHFTAFRALEPLIRRHAAGLTLDVGAGNLAWRSLLADKSTGYVAADVEATDPGVDVVYDLQQPFPFRPASFRTLFCCSVLEHVPAPWFALRHFRGVLEPGGVVILSVPFLYYLHGAPDDYYRFTPFGVRHLAGQAGLEVEEIHHSGGLFHSILQVVSITMTVLLWPRPLRPLTGLTTRTLCAIARFLDGFDRQGRFAQNVNAVLRRPS